MKKRMLNLICAFALSLILLPSANGQPPQPIDYDRTPKMYFMVELTPNPHQTLDNEKGAAIQKEHMANIAKLAKAKKLVLAGPFPEGGGLLFLSVPERAEAVTLIEADPTVKSGLNTYTIRSWVTEKGLFTLENF